MRRCPEGKIPFRDRIAADTALARRRAKDMGEIRSYQCPLCGRWHLTSQPKGRVDPAGVDNSQLSA